MTISISFDDLLERPAIRPAYQPIFDLVTGDQVGAEALVRWPELGVTPARAFHTAQKIGRIDELDEACRNAEIDQALQADIPEGFALFINVEPSTLTTAVAERLVARADGRALVVVEVTESALLRRPAELISSIRKMRAAGCGIALDNVGALPEQVALLPLIAPDVVKLNVSLVRTWPASVRAALLTTIAAYAEQSGATVLAEGIESEADLTRACALGATLGQGWYLGLPGPIETVPVPQRSLQFRHSAIPTPDTPGSLIDPAQMRIAPKHQLVALSRQLENQSLVLDHPPVVLSCFQRSENFSEISSRYYQRLAERSPLVAVYGGGFFPTPAAGVRGVSLRQDDPLRSEWNVIVVGGHYTGALLAKDLGDEGPDELRRYAFMLTHNHKTVLAAARSVLERVQPRP